jgi:hypothetical protein
MQNTLFSAIVAAFIIEIYKTLSPTNSQPTVDYIPQFRHSHQYRAVSQLLPEHCERSGMRSYPAMVL